RKLAPRRSSFRARGGERRERRGGDREERARNRSKRATDERGQRRKDDVTRGAGVWYYRRDDRDGSPALDDVLLILAQRFQGCADRLRPTRCPRIPSGTNCSQRKVGGSLARETESWIAMRQAASDWPTPVRSICSTRASPGVPPYN